MLAIVRVLLVRMLARARLLERRTTVHQTEGAVQTCILPYEPPFVQSRPAWQKVSIRAPLESSDNVEKKQENDIFRVARASRDVIALENPEQSFVPSGSSR